MTTPVKSKPALVIRSDHREWPEFDRLLSDKSDVSKATTVSALLLTLLFHGALVLSLPWALSEHAKKPVPPPPQQVEYTVQPLTADDMKFVEANPNAPQAQPQKTPNISDRNQQEAQKTPDLTSNSEAPKVKGEVKESEKIVSGDIRETPPPAPPPAPASKASQASKPSPPTPPQQAQQQPTPPTPQQPQQQVQKPAPPEPKTAQRPAQPPELKTPPQPQQQPEPPPPAEQSYQGKPTEPTPTGEGVKLTEKPVESPSQKPTESTTKEPSTNTEVKPPQPEPKPEVQQPLATVQEAQPTPPTPTPPTPDAQASPEQQPSDSPMPRRQVQVRVPAGPLMDNPNGTRYIGEVAVRSNFSQFGNYEQRMKEAIAAAWYQLVDKMNLAGDAGTHIVVMFTLDQQGTLVAMQVMNSNSSTQGTYVCTQAINSCSPFGPWTKDMCALLGQTQNVQITFWYR